jgi:hypothetical protein
VDQAGPSSPTPDFEKWAKGFSGCDGGNLSGCVWFCGIEWGTGTDHPLEDELKSDVAQPPQIYQSREDILRDRVTGTPYPYGVKLMKLIAAMRGYPVSEYMRRVVEEDPFPFHPNSDYFKLNLFPVAFRRVEPALWVKEYKTLTGFSTRKAYLKWCGEHRFPEMVKWVKRGTPKLIVGFGTAYLTDFKDAFGFDGNESTTEIIKDRRLVCTSTRNAALAVVPFLGYQKGLLNSDEVLQAFGKRLGAIKRHRGCTTRRIAVDRRA